jgi:hypothetical protein
MMDRGERKFSKMENAGLGLGCAYVLAWLAFWALIIFVAIHFIAKWW